MVFNDNTDAICQMVMNIGVATVGRKVKEMSFSNPFPFVFAFITTEDDQRQERSTCFASRCMKKEVIEIDPEKARLLIKAKQEVVVAKGIEAMMDECVKIANLTEEIESLFPVYDVRERTYEFIPNFAPTRFEPKALSETWNGAAELFVKGLDRCLEAVKKAVDEIEKKVLLADSANFRMVGDPIGNPTKPIPSSKEVVEQYKEWSGRMFSPHGLMPPAQVPKVNHADFMPKVPEEAVTQVIGLFNYPWRTSEPRKPETPTELTMVMDKNDDVDTPVVIAGNVETSK